MNVNSTAVTEPTKISQGVNSSASAGDETPEAEGFFTKLTAMLKGDGESEAKPVKASDAETASEDALLKTETTPDAIAVQADGEEGESTNDELAKQEVSGDSAAKSDQPVVISPELAKFVENSDELKAASSEQVKQTVAESEALLGRLEQANKALQSKDGNSLPPQNQTDVVVDSEDATQLAANELNTQTPATATATSEATLQDDVVPPVESDQTSQAVLQKMVAKASEQVSEAESENELLAAETNKLSSKVPLAEGSDIAATAGNAKMITPAEGLVKVAQSMAGEQADEQAAIAPIEVDASGNNTELKIATDAQGTEQAVAVDPMALQLAQLKDKQTAENGELEVDPEQAAVIAWGTPANGANDNNAKLVTDVDQLHKSASKIPVTPAPISTAANNTPQAATVASSGIPTSPMDLAAAQQFQAQATSALKPEQMTLQASMGAKAAATLAKMTQKQEAGSASDASFAQQLSQAAGQTGVTNQVRAEQAAQAQPALQLSREMAGEQVAERVQMMMSKNLKNIDIRLDPPELGRMQIRMNMNGDNATVHFTVANPQARDIVEQAMPRLREMLAQQGMQLADSSVQQQASGQQNSRYATSDGGGSGQESSGQHFGDEENLEPDVKLDLNVASKRDGISYYA